MERGLRIKHYGMQYEIAVAKLINQQRKYKTVRQLAKELNCSPNTIMSLIWNKRVTKQTAAKLLKWSNDQREKQEIQERLLE